MVKDYVNRGSRKKHSRNRPIIVLLLIVIIATALWTLKHRIQTNLPHKKTDKVRQHKVAVATPTIEKPQIKFDFYSLLPKMQVLTTTANVPSTKYYLRLPLQEAANLDPLKGILKNLGLPISIKPQKTPGQQQWTQITIGPYSQKKQALEAQSLLNKQHINNQLVNTNKQDSTPPK